MVPSFVTFERFVRGFSFVHHSIALFPWCITDNCKVVDDDDDGNDDDDDDDINNEIGDDDIGCSMNKGTTRNIRCDYSIVMR